MYKINKKYLIIKLIDIYLYNYNFITFCYKKN